MSKQQQQQQHHQNQLHRKRIREQEDKLAELLFPKASSTTPAGSDESESTEQDTLQSWSDLHGSTVDQTKTGESSSSSSAAVWVDEEEENLQVDLNATARLRKLKRFVSDNDEGNGNDDGKVSGKTFSKLLKQRALLQNEHLNVDWDRIRKIKSKNAEGRDDEEDIFANAVSFRDDGDGGRDSSNLVGSLKKLPAAKIDISRVMDANAQEPSREKITAVNFHSSGNLLLTGGSDKILRFFKIDGEKNEKQLSVRFNDMAIMSAQFIPNTSEVILGGRTPFFYSYNVETGNVQKFNHNNTYRMNFQLDDASSSREEAIRSHEHMICSPNGDKIAILSGSGYSHILDSRSKAIVTSTKINCPLRSHCFGFDDSTYITSGVDAEVYVWDIRKTNRCVLKFKHEDGLCTSTLAATNAATAVGGQNHIAVGSESGVVTLFEPTFPTATRIPSLVTARQSSIMSLTTPATFSKFHPSGQLLAIASDHKTDQLTLVHTSSGSVFQNWPTDRTPLGKVQCLDFSHGGGFLAIANHKGNVLLYRLNHFNNA